MLRLFTTNQIRKVTEIEGDWDFSPVQPEEPIPQTYSYRLPVPGCWEMHPAFRTYRGKGVYRRFIEIAEHASLRFNFKGISHTAVILFDGVEVGSHYNAYTPFHTRVIHDVVPGRHELIVLVDNSFHEESKLHFANDYFTYGGMIRPVGMEIISPIYIERIQFTPYLRDSIWGGEVVVHVANSSGAVASVSVAINLAGAQMELQECSVVTGATVAVRGRIACADAKPWSHEAPHLYLLDAKLYVDGAADPSDDLIERVGFRTVTTNSGRIQINGEDIVLKGFNRHEDHPMVGAAFPYSLMVQDMELMIEAGSNAVRTSHYPNDERFLDLCDERGILVWEENHARGFQLDHMLSPGCQEQCLACNEEMVLSHYNHPSIIIWGILNECASDTPEGRELYKEQLTQIRHLDNSRPLTYATHHREKDLCLDLVDIVSYNLYPGWYTNEDPSTLCDQARGWADQGGGLGKPMIMSEFGGDGYYGLRDATRVRGTEERQADIIESNLAAYAQKSYINGMFIWQFSDCRVVEDTGWLLSRAGTQNSKGIVDRYRRPKMAFEVVKKYFRGSHSSISV
ncbi:glycoside hydrolase family 2 protein [Paenibacillus mucilaginosus]|uniref:Beta-glucuronidase n=1 Tax=Paenibacillus mucilaginosus (strain KNP414) TaxID=1036673 RepID=F8FHT9_PAEMK|nr:glycoside hydrolase family 2 TIM barrel-domain containing protein [Paenibacillus mucilaginosus]AEI42796.1 Beta-galactosidase [Paenibacillus mucilaginosus KNP414]MCG7216885.1 beta-glucuronidase [Paenibacillus mucilaginosus]WDM30981.1 beta-glucuronidase [Paenibacillus mucilaginosus]